MKIIPLILSILVSMMALIPCSDGMSLDYDDASELLIHDHAGDSEDDCSPFCVCLCCGQLFTPEEFNYDTIRKPKLNRTKKFLFSADYSSGYPSSTWHPPSFLLF